MPHMFAKRPRLHALTRDVSDARAHLSREAINAVLYELGDVLNHWRVALVAREAGVLG